MSGSERDRAGVGRSEWDKGAGFGASPAGGDGGPAASLCVSLAGSPAAGPAAA
ncbi:hypothetical protein PSMK_15920 [Phycisphaera mikurensis NBRC 102666]|uniref:Uncharacterized protein n=1 Tax=Phycisphaera mikurensis (strain NBRC 102666 / KCTC 22515 / FYK2301M01) TaxID=1142394 RepID=I0IER3_PHYMF|nr:hypothetical protein PSMK_15920 [Phycisphaera mikurensis NBRC 102666]